MKIPFSTNPSHWSFRSQRQRVSPFPNFFSMETVCNEMKSKVGYNLNEVLYFISHNIHYMFVDAVGFAKLGRGLTEKIHKDPQLLDKLIKEQKQHGKILIEFCRRANREVSTRTSNKELAQMYEKYVRYYKEVYSRYGWIWIVEDYFMGDLLKMVSKRVADIKIASDVLNTLTIEPGAMVATVERRASLELGLKINKNKEWVSLVKEGNTEEIKKDKKLAALIKKHVKNYFWVTRDYEDPSIDFEMTVENLKKNLALGVSKEYQKLLKYFEDNDKKTKLYLHRLKLDKNELADIKSMRQISYLKELRKRYVSESLYYFDKILLEIGRRLYLTLNQVRHMITADVHPALLQGEDLTHELNERIALSLFYARAGQSGYKVAQPEAKKLFEKLCAVDKNATEFTGIPVSPGVARGPIRFIMNPDECEKVQKGDIILSVQVVPSFSTAIMKAAGLICDGGHGITTHPATLAREAGIPAVIQTRFAREVLKDGDMVEVDGYKGIVKKL